MIDGLLLNPTRAVLLDVLIGMGARIPIISIEDQHGELVGTVNVQPGELRGARISGAQTAALIDELPVLAAIAPHTRDGVEIRDAKELRVKESDRIAAVAENLRRMGAEVEEFEDGLRVPGQQQLRGAEIDSKEDHRIAMAFAVTALRAQGETKIFGADAARISVSRVLRGVAADHGIGFPVTFRNKIYDSLRLRDDLPVFSHFAARRSPPRGARTHPKQLSRINQARSRAWCIRTDPIDGEQDEAHLDFSSVGIVGGAIHIRAGQSRRSRCIRRLRSSGQRRRHEFLGIGRPRCIQRSSASSNRSRDGLRFFAELRV